MNTSSVNTIDPGTELRFWSSVERASGEGCWTWTGSVRTTGYGQFSVGGRANLKNWSAHRFSWVLANGPIPDGLLVCHRCDNRRCVRPDHLFLGTHADNMADMMAKGRPYAPRERIEPARSTREPTPRQREILLFVHRVVQSTKRPPSLREIGEHFGIASTNAITDHLVALERRGLIVRYEGQARSVRLTAEGERELGREVPVCPGCGRPK